MSHLDEKLQIAEDINLTFDLTAKPNTSDLKAHEDRAVIANLRADLVLPNNKILTVDIDFNSTSGYHNTTMMIMDDFGVEMLAAGFETKYGKEHAEKIRQAWANRDLPTDPRKPSYLLVQKPINENEMPRVYAPCGRKDHINTSPLAIV
ncbi:hypothetical protein WNY51_17005 [Pseudocolwellia sp. AS88]|jgi:hypothetical protein|uniref:hypothetical protein n=1 Tax=Pseudocolwellia sp. AS88 TaxID=3063958 RepID=UPI0026F30AF1|nr:hypothetical protein [Pseudocolwellia sp. AS88]MDO7086424.1 hypothetical protein [Pseudocolwellia sp. AS88]